MVASSVSSENCSRASHGNLPLPFTLKLPEAYFELKKVLKGRTLWEGKALIPLTLDTNLNYCTISM